MKLPISNICFIKETAHVQIIYPFKFMTKAKLSFVSFVNIQRFYRCKLRGPSFFNLHILLRILRKNQYNKWTKYKEKLIVFQLT